MKRECCQCGRVDDERWMKRLNNGRSVKWLCYECDRKAQAEVIGSEVRSQKQYRRTIDL